MAGRRVLFLRAGQNPSRKIFRKFDVRCSKARALHATTPLFTDGVFSGLTAMRVAKPWIQALREQEHGQAKSEPTRPVETVKELKPKKMSSSYHSLILPLAQDPWLGDNYLSSTGHVRLGTIFMDLDALAGVVAYEHTGESVMTVTAAVDRITIKQPLEELCDLELSGQVTFATGRSSMEISLQVAKAPTAGRKVQPEDVLLNCAFTMVSLDPVSKKPVSVPSLQIETPEEKTLFDLGEKNYRAKKAIAETTLRKNPPNADESSLVHSIWRECLKFRDPTTPDQKPPHVHYMGKTILRSAQIMQPQYRNRHNFMVFGGFLLKQTFELAFTCAAAFSHTRPTFVSLDPSTFENPVPVGSVLYLSATVAYTDHAVASEGHEKATRIQVRVDSKVRNVEHGETKPTGQFNYTFVVDKEIECIPETYSEFMIWVDARRRAQRVDDNATAAAMTLASKRRESITG